MITPPGDTAHLGVASEKAGVQGVSSKNGPHAKQGVYRQINKCAWGSVGLDRVSRENCLAQGLGSPGWPRRQLGILSALFRSAPSDLAFVRGAAFDFVFSVRPTTRVVRRALLPTNMYHLSRRRAPPSALECPGECSATAQVVPLSCANKGIGKTRFHVQ